MVKALKGETLRVVCCEPSKSLEGDKHGGLDRGLSYEAEGNYYGFARQPDAVFFSGSWTLKVIQ
jgi:hypothetical protein